MKGGRERMRENKRKTGNERKKEEEIGETIVDRKSGEQWKQEDERGKERKREKIRHNGLQRGIDKNTA